MSDRTPTTPAVSPMLLRAKDAAAALAVSERKLWELTNCGAIPAVRIGRSVRYDVADLQAFAAARKARGGRR